MANVVKADSLKGEQRAWLPPDLAEISAGEKDDPVVMETIAPKEPETEEEPVGLAELVQPGEVEGWEEPEELEKPEAIYRPPEPTIAIQNAREEGYQAGYAEGYAKGYAEGETEGVRVTEERYAANLQSLQQLYDALIAQRKQMIREAESEMLSLSFDIAKKILGREVRQDDMQIQSLFRQAVGALMEKQRITVRVAMGEGQALNAFKEEISHDLGLDGFEIVEDPDLPSMSCLVETPNEQVDASLDTQFNRVCNGLVDRMKVRMDDERDS